MLANAHAPRHSPAPTNGRPLRPPPEACRHGRGLHPHLHSAGHQLAEKGQGVVLAGAQGAPRRVLPLAALDLQAELLNLWDINWQAEPRIQHLAQLQGEETTGGEGRERGHRARSEHMH